MYWCDHPCTRQDVLGNFAGAAGGDVAGEALGTLASGTAEKLGSEAMKAVEGGAVKAGFSYSLSRGMGLILCLLVRTIEYDSS